MESTGDSPTCMGESSSRFCLDIDRYLAAAFLAAFFLGAFLAAFFLVDFFAAAFTFFLDFLAAAFAFLVDFLADAFTAAFFFFLGLSAFFTFGTMTSEFAPTAPPTTPPT